MFSVLQVSERLLFKVSINEQILNVPELHHQTLEFFIVVVFDIGDLLAHAAKFPDLILDFILELVYFAAQVIYGKLVKHRHFMLSVVAKQTLEADGAEALLTESFDVFC